MKRERGGEKEKIFLEFITIAIKYILWVNCFILAPEILSLLFTTIYRAPNQGLEIE